MRVFFGFALLCSLIGSKNSRHFLNQSEAKLKPIANWSHAFSRAWRWLHVFASSSDWFFVLFASVVIGQSDYYYTHLKTALYSFYICVEFLWSVSSVFCYIFSWVLLTGYSLFISLQIVNLHGKGQQGHFWETRQKIDWVSINMSTMYFWITSYQHFVTVKMV